MKDQVIRIRMTDDGALTISYEKMKIMEASDNYIVLYSNKKAMYWILSIDKDLLCIRL